MEEIKHDYHTYKEQKYQVIKCWVNKSGKAGTIINLLRHIYFDLNDKRLVMKVVEELKHASKRSGEQIKTVILVQTFAKFLHKEFKRKFELYDTIGYFAMNGQSD